MKKVLIITSIRPDKYNRDGPSGLIYECIRVLEKHHIDYKVDVIEGENFLNKLGVFFHKYFGGEEADLILVYPFHLFFKLRNNLRGKAIVLGPDSPTLLFRRIYKTTPFFSFKIKYLILMNLFLYLEKKLLNECYRFLVVGKNDLRWLRKINSENAHKIKYLTHPILESIIQAEGDERNIIKEGEFNNKTLVFVGDLSPKYSYKHIMEIYKVLEFVNLNIYIVGRKNRWIYDLFVKHPRRRIKINYIEWIDDYNKICNPRFHIHVIPLSAGAGTKNRTLTACAKGLTIISTEIGLENIMYGRPVNKIYKFDNAKQFLDAINQLNDGDFFPKYIDISDYIQRVNTMFEKEFLNYLELE